MSVPKFQNYNHHDKHLFWVPCSNGILPDHAVEGGFDSDSILYVGRGVYNGAMIPGKFHSGHRSLYVSYGGQEIALQNYEILVDPKKKLEWSQSSHGQREDKAVIGGVDCSGEKYLIGRARISGSLTVGKVHPSQGKCYLPYGGQEHGAGNYEVLKYK